MTKKAIITISLVPESEMEKNETIKEQIKEEGFIPWCKEIEKVTVREA
jgi:hypothetical protein